MQVPRKTMEVLGAPIDVTTWSEAVDRLTGWASIRSSRVVCICNTHSLVTSKKDAKFRQVLEAADMATADGAPVAWLMRLLGAEGQARINGPDLMWKVCAELNESGGASIFLYGSTEDTLEKLNAALKGHFPKLRIAGSYSPPFRTLNADEIASVRTQINDSGAGIVWVSLGCPKQEGWMFAQRGHISAAMVGVGAAFDYHAGTLERAPLWMRNNGLEWLYRLLQEPRRLWRRYLVNNSLFLYWAVRHHFDILLRPKSGVVTVEMADVGK